MEHSLPISNSEVVTLALGVHRQGNPTACDDYRSQPWGSVSALLGCERSPVCSPGDFPRITDRWLDAHSPARALCLQSDSARARGVTGTSTTMCRRCTVLVSVCEGSLCSTPR